MPASAVATRDNLAEYLSQSLLAEYYDRVDGRITRQVATSLKTYLVEFHVRGDSWLEALHGTSFAEVHATREQTLIRVHDRRGNAYFFDFLDDRFPMVHTIARSSHSDEAIERFVRTASGADRCWLPSSFLLSQGLGRVIGFRFSHRRVTGGLSDSDEAMELARDLGKQYPPAFRLRVSEYAHAGEDLEALRSTTMFGSRSAVDSLAWRTAREDADGQFIHNEVWSRGKVSAYGTSWETHLGNVLTVRGRYRDAVSILEERFALRWGADGLSGEPISLRLDGHPITDVMQFASDLLRGTTPFRLLGWTTLISESLVAVDAIDVHTGHRLSLDISPRMIRVYLRTETCGNVLMRLLTNLEHHLSSDISTSVDRLLGSGLSRIA